MELVYLLLLLLVLPILWYFYRRNIKGANLFDSGLTVLSRYSRDLTQMARMGKLDPVIGRQAEINRVIQVLSRRTKNNPVLTGRAGIGKTAIVEGLALAIVKKNVPQVLCDKKVLSLDLTSILAGTKYRGEFEQRLKRITDEIINSKRSIILFIDEIHVLAEAGEAEGAINAADILKPPLARGDLQVVGATTKDEYDQYIKKDKTLDRRLQPISIHEPTKEQTKEILKGVKKVYENYHQVVITEAAITEAVEMTEPILERAYPDKAIDAIDEACSRARLSNLGRTGHQNWPEVTDKDVREIILAWRK